MKFAILLLFLISINCIDITDDLFTWPNWPEYQFKTWSGLIDLDDDGVTRYVEFHY
jgi:serine carboxypeptidase-like clade 2